MTQTDVPKPTEDPYVLVGDTWPTESESAYHAAKIIADDSSAATSAQSESATDARSKMAGESGETANSVSNGYASVATQLSEQSREFTTISAWMSDAAGAVLSAKRQVVALVRAGTSEIRYALDSETSGIAVTPSSAELTTKYRNEIQGVNSKLSVDLGAIGHSLHSDAGSSNTPSYVSVPLTSTAQHPNPAAQVAAYNHGDQPAVEPHQLPPMPRASAPTPESPSTPGTPSAPTTSPHAVNPTLSNLVTGGTSPSGTPSSPSTSAKSPSTAPSGTPAGQSAQAHQSNEHRQDAKSPVLPRVPSIGLPDLPAAAQTIATAVSSATAHQLPTTSPPSTPTLPASTGLTPGTSGTAPVLPTPPAGLSPVGGLPTPPPVMQGAPAIQGTPGTTSPAAPAPSPQSPPAPPRGPAADLGWIQRTYGLAPGVELPKSENQLSPAVFIANLAEGEAHLHRVLATIRHQFEGSGWGQPLAVATIRRGFETRTVYATADGLSIWPQGVQLPSGVIPLDEMPSTPTAPELHGSLMVSEKLTALIPRGWEVEGLLSTVSGGESSQSAEQFQELVGAGELLECTVSRGRDDVEAEEAMRVFARAALGSAGCGELDVDSARIRAARWVGVQPAGYLDTLARYYLSDAAESMSRGNWSEAVYSSEKYMSVNQARSQAA
ncbi:Uncharacterised protein [Mycobacteroides abscessus subsp. abscessus]|nr:Uncharacterised protein [Mycobacteroides abscessus subsp. abscessus]